MARIYKPTQRKSDLRWDYTCESDEENWIHAVGYCAGYRDPGPSILGPEMTERLRLETEPYRAKYHTDGHATPEEAMACHRDYELDQRLRFFDEPSTQRQCGICSTWTTGRARLGEYDGYTVCPAHQTRESVATLAAK